MTTQNINLVAELLRREEVVAIPTETVYGLAGNAYSLKAINRIFEIKQRPLNNPLILHFDSIHKLNEIACEIPEIALELATRFWPGPLTLLLKKKSIVPDLITAGNDTVAVRIPNHDITLNLLSRLEFPLAAPSANPFGSISPTTSNHVASYFGDEIAAILEGGMCSNGVESTIIGFNNSEPVIHRLGAIPAEAINAIFNRPVVQSIYSKKAVAPGMFPRHYAPKTEILLTEDIHAAIYANASKRLGILLFKGKLDLVVEHLEVLSPSGNLNEAAKNLYASLHRLDAAQVELIIAEKMPEYGLGLTINDRLNRAITKL